MNDELTWNERWYRMLAGMQWKNKHVAEITGLSVGHILNSVKPSKEFPNWAKGMVVVYERLALK